MPKKTNKTINEIQFKIINDFKKIIETKDQELYISYLMELGEKLEKIPEIFKTESAIVHGCNSKVWISFVREKKIRTREKRTINFLVESDSNFTGGILYLLLEIFNNQKYEDIIESDLFFIKEIGLINILGNQRSMGLANIVKHMKMIALMEKVRIRRGRKRLDQKNNEIYS